MSIFMIGIDHNMAPVDVRAQFAFTRKNTGEALRRLKEEAGICGCIILSTCNRLELWVSTADEEKPDLYQWLCSLKGVQGEMCIRDSSWMNRLSSEGYEVTPVLKGLGEYPQVCLLYTSRCV